MLKRYAALCLCIIIWGFNPLPVKLALKTWPPFLVAAFPACVAASILWIVRGKTTWRQIKSHFVPELLFLGLFGTFGFNFFMNTALKQTTVINASFLLATTPALGFVFDRVVFKERFRLSRVLGAGLSILGIVFLVSNGEWQNVVSFRFNPGDLYVFGAIFCFVLFIAATKKIRHLYDPVTLATATLTMGVFLFSPFVFNARPPVMVKETGWLLWASLAYIAFFTAIGTNVLYTYALKKITMTTATTFSNAIPLVSSVFAVLILGERFSLVHLVAACLIIGGVVCSTLGLLGRQPRSIQGPLQS